MDIVHLVDCQPFVTKDGSIIRELLSHRNSTIRNQSLAEATIPIGARTDSHYHPKSEEIYFIVSGTGTMFLADQTRRVVPGDAVAIPPSVIHSIFNDGSEPLKLLCCCAPGYEHDDTVMVSEQLLADDHGIGFQLINEKTG